ncbi:uncharacterized protein SPPG_03839 [Spizellomyces punctatus DAOM BR117]|uniref:DEUBAD domain-containing protein n=1 Tax=Spizellomyces punctatus (strain DAOM BR117) TaxID=645134 RepID=A0A0L0HHZ9_SPIPD|nr:uncharacterized protein SPPG_03839 [Spizellomyces punctatus DAOM BR117]KND00723.1 hypothetical protein SPPG_03839 [Spizellomyces punctatus DAOM BR117]|eukprot:XP_016608762.1 hypothetical protein SPPG_03839 [Spizellomyces punctatus DAOM BR117]
MGPSAIFNHLHTMLYAVIHEITTVASEMPPKTKRSNSGTPHSEVKIVGEVQVDSSTPTGDKRKLDVVETVSQDAATGEDREEQVNTPRRSMRSKVTAVAASKTSSHVNTPRAKRVKLDAQSIEYLLTNRKSKLGKSGLDLKKIFSFEVFQMLSPEDQDELTQLVPSVDRANARGIHDPPLTERFFKYSTHLRESIGVFQDMLAGGFYEPAGQEQMVQEVEDTKKDYDSWKEQNYEEVWGDHLDQEVSEEIASIAKTITLKEMCEQDILRSGDEFVYKRSFGKIGVTVEKAVKIISVDGTLRVQSGNATWADIEAPTRLETLILDQDKRVSKNKRPNGNAWKSIRLRRNGKDMGKLSEMRNDLAISGYGKGIS